MKWSEDHNSWLAKKVLPLWQANKNISFKATEALVLEGIIKVLNEALEVEKEIEQEVRVLLDQLEQTEQGGFDRRKMYQLLKNKLAEKKGVVL